jgi:HlyD family secretion protein
MQSKTTNSMHSASRIFTSVVPLTVLLFALGCTKKDATPAVVVEVQARAAAHATIAEHIEADAILAPLAQAAIAPKITAPVRKFYVQRGAKVKQGELLATLENRDLKAAAIDNKGAYTAAEATYQATTKAQVPEDYQKAQLDYNQAKANLGLSQKIFDARKDLFKQGAIPGRDLDTSQAALVQAQAAFDGAEKHLDSMKAVSHEAALTNAVGQFDSAKGKYLGAQAQLSYSEIRSPINGVVTDRPLYAGETAAAGTPLLTVMDTSSMLAKMHLPQSQAQMLKVGAPAEMKVPGMEDPVEGTLSLISPALDPGSTTVEVWVKLKNSSGTLKAGTPVHVSITGKTLNDALVIPKSAVVADASGKKSVMVIDASGVAHTKEVTIGIEDGQNVQVLSGIDAGQTIITNGAYALDDGTKVKVVSATDEKDSGGDKPEAGKPDGGN